MGNQVKKYAVTVLLSLCALLTVAFAANSSLFPVAQTAADGTVQWGYMNESGRMVTEYIYSEAGDMNENGVAVVRNANGEYALVNSDAVRITDYQVNTAKVEFGENQVAFRYTRYSIYFDLEGNRIGQYMGAAGFFSDGLLRCQDPRTGLWGYMNEAGEWAIAADYNEAGAFRDGFAIVKSGIGAEATWKVINPKGGRAMSIPEDLDFTENLTIYENDVVIVSGREVGFTLYSLKNRTYPADDYEEISPFQDGYAAVKKNGKWGVLNSYGKLTVEPQYYYLSNMGGGLYAARGEGGDITVLSASTDVKVYHCDSYAGGFEPFRYGLSWHSTTDGGAIFFRNTGAVYTTLDNVENPVVQSANVIAVTQDSIRSNIRLTDGKILHTDVRTATLGSGVSLTTVSYEKYLGKDTSGKDIAWDISYPQMTGMKDQELQVKINASIETFFMNGPVGAPKKEALSGNYGYEIVGNVLVVYANCMRGSGIGSIRWNASVAVDLLTGATYVPTTDLLAPGYAEICKTVLPQDVRLDACWMRFSAKGVVLYYNTEAAQGLNAETTVYIVPYTSLQPVMKKDSACFAALFGGTAAPPDTNAPADGTDGSDSTADPDSSDNADSSDGSDNQNADSTNPGGDGGDALQTPEALLRYNDVPKSYWAYSYIESASHLGLVQGNKGQFWPGEAIRASEVCATLARALTLPSGKMPGIQSDKWYAGEVGAAYEAGLLNGLEEDFQVENAMDRADAMQMLENALRRKTDDQGALTEYEIAQQLAKFPDSDLLPAERREAAAYCIRSGVIVGSSDGKLHPMDSFARAEFVKLLLAIVSGEI